MTLFDSRLPARDSDQPPPAGPLPDHIPHQVDWGTFFPSTDPIRSLVDVASRAIPPLPDVHSYADALNPQSLQGVIVHGLLASMPDGREPSPMALADRLALLHTIAHAKELPFAERIFRESFLLTTELIFEWRKLAFTGLGRLATLNHPLPTQEELAQWIAPVVPHILILPSDWGAASVWAGHLAWHLRDHGGLEMLQGSPYSSLELFSAEPKDQPLLLCMLPRPNQS